MFFLFLLVNVRLWKEAQFMKSSDHVIMQGTRCISRCLQNHVQSAKHTSLSYNVTVNAFDSCIGYEKCLECMKPCTEQFSSLEHCLQFCGENLNCMYSCAFFNDMSGSKMGFCPAPFTFSMRYSKNAKTLSKKLEETTKNLNCQTECQTDFCCPTNYKCCTTGCSETCRPPLIRKTWLPPLLDARGIHLAEQDHGKSVLLSWTPTSITPISGWVMYIVQEKYQLSEGVPTKFRTKWSITAQTPDTRITLIHLRRGYWYQFRIAAVNVNGTKGFTVAKQPFRLKAEPRRPPKPVALQQVSLRITRGAKYNAQLKWKMLKASDLPVKGFHVTWAQQSHKSHKVRHTNRRSFVKASSKLNQNGETYWIAWVHKLHYYLKYNVSISAASGWKNIMLYSQEEHIIVKYPLTTPTHRPTKLAVNLPFRFVNDSVDAKLTWNFNFTEAPEKYVKFLVEWRIHSCLEKPALEITTKRELSSNAKFDLRQLFPACQYMVSIQALYGSFRNQWSQRTQLIFSTPPCGVENKDLVVGSCEMDDPAAGSLPTKLTQTHVLTTSNGVKASFYWKPPKLRQHAVGYFLYTTNNLDLGIRWIAIKSKSYPNWTFGNLLPARIYVLHLIAVFKSGRTGREVSTRFRTPQKYDQEN
ncbi:unnamed protein product [Clavelina lepadiformis]|uniref:Anosmin-1 n=1 Tax=Clavelina lepadiformis TaxID=159417 RepID=A0ABP0H331_CLALP